MGQFPWHVAPYMGVDGLLLKVNEACCGLRRLELGQFGDATSPIPVFDVKITRFVKTQAVGSRENSETHGFWAGGKFCPLCLIWIVAEKGNWLHGLNVSLSIQTRKEN